MNNKQLLASALAALLVGIAYFVYTSVISRNAGNQPATPIATSTQGAFSASVSVEQRAEDVLRAFKDHDGAALSVLVHPTKGVRFSPAGHISTSTDVVIQAAGFSDIYNEGKKEVWGTADGSGAPIELTFTDYSKKFIYDQDFLQAPQRATNSILGKGNTHINIVTAYPGNTFVEYYFPGFNPTYEGMDWKSLRLIFEKDGQTWYLVGVSHDEWSI